MTKNEWLFLVFSIYMVALFCFAALYHRIYRKSPHSFAFGGDISQRQLDTVTQARRTEEQRLLVRLGFLPELIQKLRDNNSNPPAYFNADGTAANPRTIFTTETFNLSLTYRPPASAGLGAGLGACVPSALFLRVEDKRGDLVDEADVIRHDKDDHLLRTTEEWTNMAEAFLNKTETALRHLRQEISDLSQPNPEIWSFWDFLYFSTITQGTVGYGDILPNSTNVRMVVTAQTLLTTALLVVVINLAFGGH